MTERRWVINASPLICLGKISKLDLLQKICTEIVIPEGVFLEIQRGRESDPARKWLEGEGNSFIREVTVAPIISSWGIGEGESQVLSWAYRNPGFRAIIDDLAARRCASTLNIPAKGCVGVVLLAEQKGLIPEIKTVLDELVEVGLRVSEKLIQEALELAGELEE